MNIRTSEDNTGFATEDSRWTAIDYDTYDGAEPMGIGATEADAIADLRGKTGSKFDPEDYTFTADLLRQYMNGNPKSFHAVCSNNLNIILAALDQAGAAPDLLDALKDITSGWRYIRRHYGDLSGVGWDRAQSAAEAAISKAESAS